MNSSIRLLKSFTFLATAALLLPILSGCRTSAPEPPLERHAFVRAAMGTQFRVTLYAPNAITARTAADRAFDRIDKLEEILSDYQADSELSLLREHPPGTPIKVSQDLFDVLWKADEISRATHGAFDVTSGPYTRLWRFSRKRKTLPSTSELAEARKSVGFEKLILDEHHRTVTMSVPGMRLDVGGIAKGYAADAALSTLKDFGMGSALVAASGDIAVGDPLPGRKTWSVAIAQPGADDTNRVKTLHLRNQAVSTSGDTEQFVEIDGIHYSHILDMATGLGMTNRAQVTVVAPTATLSDPLATALRILGPDKGRQALRKIPGTTAVFVSFPTND